MGWITGYLRHLHCHPTTPGHGDTTPDWHPVPNHCWVHRDKGVRRLSNFLLSAWGSNPRFHGSEPGVLTTALRSTHSLIPSSKDLSIQTIALCVSRIIITITIAITISITLLEWVHNSRNPQHYCELQTEAEATTDRLTKTAAWTPPQAHATKDPQHHIYYSKLIEIGEKMTWIVKLDDGVSGRSCGDVAERFVSLNTRASRIKENHAKHLTF